ncbi:MAG: ABC transporter ATP-binding protein [Pirellulales bacterium]
MSYAPDILVRVDRAVKHYFRGSECVEVLHEVNLEIERGDFVGLIGPSGSGKTTLLNLIAGLDQPTSGQIFFDGHEISAMNEAQLARWRTNAIGFVFQFFHLIPVLTAFENVELPLLLTNMSGRRRREQVRMVLRAVGLDHREHHRPGQMSGGEQQRVGIARALVTDPALIVADEPTGDLDTKKSKEILDLLQLLQEELHKTLLVVTHDPTVAARTRRLLRIDSGRLIEDRCDANRPLPMRRVNPAVGAPNPVPTLAEQPH